MSKHPAALAKLTRPHLSGILSRQRLFGHLDQGREKSIIWVGGPPGSGKTTLVADYLDTWAPECVWYQVDPGDSDVATFFHYMSQALPEQAGGDRKSLPRFSPEYQRNIPAFSRRYFRELFAQLTSPFALVLDNYQDLPGQSRLHEVLREGLEEIPDGGCVIFISRRDPPTAMARFRANQTMEVLDPDDLKLSRDETRALVKLRGHDLSDDALVQIYERTQGWAAGLVLLLGRSGDAAPVADLPTHTTPQVVFDYLAGEIFENVAADTRDLLLKTAWFPQFTAKMADALCGHETSADFLEGLAREDYFVTARHGERDTVYQFHPLLREFLLRRAEETLKTRDRSELQALAASLLEEAGQIEDAVSLRVASRDWQELNRIIQQHAESMLEQGRGETLEQWLEELPPTRLENDPWMMFWLAACRLSTAPRESRRLYQRAYENFSERPEPDIHGLFAALAGVMYAILNELDDLTLLDRWIDESLKLTARYPDFPSPAVEARVTGYTFMSMVFRQPSHPDIEDWGERTAALGESDLEPNQLAEVSIIMAAATIWTGRFHLTEIAIGKLQALVQYPEVPTVIHTTLHNVEAMYCMLVGDYPGCMAAVDAGRKLAEKTGINLWRNRTLIFGAGAALGAGELEQAQALLEELDQQSLARARFDSVLYRYFLGWKAMLEEDLLSAYQELRSAQRTARESGMAFFEVLTGLALAQVLFASGDLVKTRRHLRRIKPVAASIHNRWLEFTTLLAYAQLTLDQGRRQPGLKALRYALSVGREKRYMHTIWWQPRVMARLCQTALTEGIETDYVRQLIRQRSLFPTPPPLNVANWPWRFRVFTLGHFELTGDGDKNLLAGREGRPVELLKTTVAFGGRDVSVDRITDLMWPNIDRDYAHRSFNTTLHRLRKLLGEDSALTLANNQLSLNPRMFWIDTWALDQTFEEMRKAMRRTAGQDELMERAEQVMALYQGSFMPGDEDASWVVSPREQFNNRFVRFIGDVGHWLEENDSHAEAIDLYFRGLEANELAEGLYRHLMLCYQELGRRAEAIEVYNRCCKTLEARLKLHPSQETRDVYETLVNAA